MALERVQHEEGQAGTEAAARFGSAISRLPAEQARLCCSDGAIGGVEEVIQTKS